MNATTQRIAESVGAGICRRIVSQDANATARSATTEVLASAAAKARSLVQVSWPERGELTQALGKQQLTMADLVRDVAGALPAAQRAGMELAAEQIQIKAETFLNPAPDGGERPRTDVQR